MWRIRVRRAGATGFEQNQHSAQDGIFSDENFTGILPGFGSYSDRNRCFASSTHEPEEHEHEIFWKAAHFT